MTETGVAGGGNAGPGSPSEFTLQGPDGSEASIHELRAGFQQGFVFELVDLSAQSEPLEVIVLVLNPRSYTLSEPFQLTLTPTEDNTVIAEENGIIIREITLEGTFGLTKKKATGFLGAQGNGASLSGTEHFNKLRNMFRRYSSLKKDPARNADIQLIFHSLRDEDHFIVTPRSFETPRDARTTRVHYDYRIQLAAIGAAETSLLERQPSTSDFDFTDVLREINEAFNDARGAFADATKRVSEIKRKVANISTVLNNAAQIINAVGGFLSGTADLINFPLRAVTSAAESLAGAADTLADSIDDVAGTKTETFSSDSRNIRRIEAAFDRIAMFPSKFEDSIERISGTYQGPQRFTVFDVENNVAGAQDSARTEAVAGSAHRFGLDLDTGGGTERVRVSRTDTIDSIAADAGTSPETIIIINDLRPPYISSGGGPGVKRPGDTMLIPSRAGGGTSTEPGSEYLSPEDALYGVDFKFDDEVLRKEGRFDLSVANSLFDAELSSGVANVVQGTQITVLTEIGATVFVPEVGLRRNVGTKGTIQHVLLASIRLREGILVDPRISGIQSLRVVLDGDVLTQEITPIIGTSRRGVKLVLPFGRASG